MSEQNDRAADARFPSLRLAAPKTSRGAAVVVRADSDDLNAKLKARLPSLARSRRRSRPVAGASDRRARSFTPRPGVDFTEGSIVRNRAQGGDTALHGEVFFLTRRVEETHERSEHSSSLRPPTGSHRHRLREVGGHGRQARGRYVGGVRPRRPRRRQRRAEIHRRVAARPGPSRDRRHRVLRLLRVPGAFYLTLVPIRPRSRGERRSLRTYFTSRRISPPTPRCFQSRRAHLDAFQLRF